MAIASGSCPSCGAPIDFKVGASVSKVCEYCKATVYRTDRGLEDLGKVAAIANVPSLVAVDDDGILAGRPFRVAGRVQLDHGSGPWDEFYVAFDGGADWGWLAYAEGVWYVTSLLTERLQPPSFDRLLVESDVPLGRAGMFRVAEMKTGRVVSAEGELPARMPPGFTRHYVDLFGAGRAFATIDYGDRSTAPEIFIGRRFEERELSVTARAPRTVAKVKMGSIRCPSCGGELPKLSGERAERMGCRYCGAVSDIAAQKLISTQDVARMASPIPIGSTGTLYGAAFTAIACLERSTLVEGEWFSWVEVLLFAEGVGFRWLVRDETSWLFVVAVNLAELDMREMPGRVHFQGHRYSQRNSGVARVDYVLGEVYWKCEVGETVHASDYILGTNVLSREESPGEVRWSHSTAVPWPVVAQVFGLPRDRPGGAIVQQATRGMSVGILAIIVVFVIVMFAFALSGRHGGGGGGGGAVFGGSGTYYGGQVTAGVPAAYDDARVHAWVLGTAASLLLAVHHAYHLYALYVAPADDPRSGVVLAAIGVGIGAAVARRLAPLAERVAPPVLYALAVAVGSSSFAAFAAFPLGPWAPPVACACIGVILCASTVTAAITYRAAGRAATALGLVPFALHPIRLGGALLVLIAIEAGSARAGLLIGGILLSGAIVMLAMTFGDLHALLYGAALPGFGPLRATGVALTAAALVSLCAAEEMNPLGEQSRFADEVVFRTDAGDSTYTVVASPGGYELFGDGQVAIASLDEHRRTRALVAPALRLSPRARRVLLLNGGLGMVEREILRDARVEELVVVVSEPMRVELARNLAFLAKRAETTLDSPRLRTVLAEPLAWLALATERPDRFDVIIADFPWPLGYGEGKLYTHYAFSRLAAHLAAGGVAVVPGASRFSAPAAFAEIVATLASTGLHTYAYHVPVPTIGMASFVVGSVTAIDQAALLDVPGLDTGLDLGMPLGGRIRTLHDESVVLAMEEAREKN